MNTNVQDSHNQPSKLSGLAALQIRSCRVCGINFSATKDNSFCPACMLRKALAGDIEYGESPSEDIFKPIPEHVTQRFDHYELVTHENGEPIELGRGAMGVTYKAFDINLRYPVALKVISERNVGDESARLRFLREARAAASVRHPNIASVFHIGKTGENYFYAMEFVDGETLENLIRRSGRLEVKLALEITSQITAGLAAVHKQKLVHRDIKPSNIMVSLEDEGAVTAKIIDLGLAKAIKESGSQTAISTPGVFAGTPEFASPEQFAGIPVDIRSDLYSLGVVLWEMLAGRAPFHGSPAEVMYQHQHAPLPLEQLEDVPQPVVVLLGVLLQKDPCRRFQNPTELLKAMPTITDSLDAGRTITHQSFQKIPDANLRAVTRKPSAKLGPKKISVARLPLTGSNLFGREEDIAFLDDAWENQHLNVVTIVAWGGVGKSTLVNHWLRRMAVDYYRSAQLVFGWSFYQQGTPGDTSSADEFLDATLAWFGDTEPRLGTGWEKGERLARLIAQRRTLLILDGLEPLQNPPGPQEGRLREPSLQALLRELAAFNRGLSVISTRMAVADLADYEGTSASCRNLDHLSREAGAQLLQALGVRGSGEDLKRASDEFQGHGLALTLLGSYLTDAYNGENRRRDEVSKHLADDVRQGAHVRKVMASYESWLGDGPELSVLRLLGLFDRPASEPAIGALLKPPAIPGLTESLMGLDPAEWRTLLARLRRARLLAEEEPHNLASLDAHPLVREYFGEQLRTERVAAWQAGNLRLYEHHRALAPELPESFRNMEPLFLAVSCGCQAGLYRQVLHEIYIPRIQRGEDAFAANVLGARGALLSALAHFFEGGRWGAVVQGGTAGQSLTPEDQLFILMQAGMQLTAIRGMGAPEARLCYERAEALCQSLQRPLTLYSALTGQWLFYLITDKLSATMRIAQRVYALAQQQDNASLMINACGTLASPLYLMGEFEAAYQHASRGVQLWRSNTPSKIEEIVSVPAVICLSFKALCEWHLGEFDASQTTTAQTISLAKALGDMYALAEALFFATMLGHFERKAAEVECLASDLIDLSTRHHFALYAAGGEILCGWARSVSNGAAEGLACLENGIKDWQETGARLFMPYWLTLKAEALHLADHTLEAIEAIKEAEGLIESSTERWCCAELHRLHGVFLKALGAEETEIEASFCAAIRIAKQQKSISLAMRAEATYAEYRRKRRKELEGTA